MRRTSSQRYLLAFSRILPVLSLSFRPAGRCWRPLSWCRPAFVLSIKGVRHFLGGFRWSGVGRGLVRRGLGFAAGAAAASFIAEATTSAPITIIWCRRTLHVRTPVHQKLIGRSPAFVASSTHPFLRLYPDRFSVLRQVVAPGADIRVCGVGWLVHHQPVSLRSKAQAVVLRLRLSVPGLFGVLRIVVV